MRKIILGILAQFLCSNFVLIFSLLPHCPAPASWPSVRAFLLGSIGGSAHSDPVYIDHLPASVHHPLPLLPPVPGGGQAEVAVIVCCHSSSQECRAGTAAKRKRKKSRVMTLNRLLFHPGAMAWLGSMSQWQSGGWRNCSSNAQYCLRCPKTEESASDPLRGGRADPPFTESFDFRAQTLWDKFTLTYYIIPRTRAI